MKSLIGIYDTHDKAIKAIKLLKGEDFPEKNISLLGKTTVEEDGEKAIVDDKDKKIVEGDTVKESPLVVGAVVGPVLGVLTGVGVFAIPGLGFLYGAGAMLGAIAGFDFGLVGGGIVSLFTALGIGKKDHLEFQEYLKGGKAILIARGEEDEIKMAHDALSNYNEHHDLLLRTVEKNEPGK